MSGFLPILIYTLAVIGFAAVSLILPHLVAPREIEIDGGEGHAL